MTRVMRGLAQIGPAGVGLELRPERVDDLVACQPPPRLQAQQLHQLRRTQAGPALGRQFGTVDAHGEATQQLHLQSRQRCSAGIAFGHIHTPSVRLGATDRNPAPTQERFRNTDPASWRLSGLSGATYRKENR